MSIGINGTTESLQIVLGANTTTNPIAYTTTWADQAGFISDNTGTIATTTATTIVPAPAASVNRAISGISIVNQDTVAATITINKIAATTARLIRIVLQAGTQLYYENGYGWAVLDGNGNILNSSALPVGVTLNQPNIVGVTNSSNALAGSVGEYVQATFLGVALTTAIIANVASISLTAGDWDVDGNVNIGGTGSNLSEAVMGASLTSATFSANAYAQILVAAGAATLFTNVSQAFPVQRISIAATTTVFCVARASFTSGSSNASGVIRARRVR